MIEHKHIKYLHMRTYTYVYKRERKNIPRLI